MKFELKYKLLLHKSYFDKGWSFASVGRYALVLTGLAEGFSTGSMKLTLIIAAIYGFCCYIFGIFFYKYNWIRAEHEVANRFNLIMQEIRASPIMNGKQKNI